jgi:hypothetical protein
MFWSIRYRLPHWLVPFRTNEWLLSKGGAFLGFLLFGLTLYQVPLESALRVIGLELVLMLGFGSFGHLLNDWGDIDADARAGKRNRVAGLSNAKRWLLLVLCLVLMVVPWIWLPRNIWNVGAAIAEAFLLFAYPMRPFRLKERGNLAAITDSLYAMVLPAIIALSSFWAIAAKPDAFPLPAIAFFLVALFLNGLRGIYAHHVADRHGDAKAGHQTIVHQNGYKRVMVLNAFILVPIETLCLIIATYLLAWSPLSYMVLVFLAIEFIWLWFVARQTPKRIILAVPVHMNRIYFQYLPLGMLTFWALVYPWVWVLAFWYLLQCPLRLVVSRIVNYSIYYTRLGFKSLIQG